MVHAYKALGGLIGMFALFAAAEGRIERAFLLLIVTMLIDATDGILARIVRVREALPDFDGAMMDNVIDVLTFVWVPVFIIWREHLTPDPLWIIAPILAALYAYGQINMKTEDSFFLGFPSYWNVVALYLYWLQPEPIFAVLIIVAPAILTFIPTRYLYPSKNQILWKTTWGLGAIWVALVIYLLAQKNPQSTLIWFSLFYPIYYMAASFYIDQKLRGNT
jgi:phosphatidylcholine synthase